MMTLLAAYIIIGMVFTWIFAREIVIKSYAEDKLVAIIGLIMIIILAPIPVFIETCNRILKKIKRALMPF